MTKPGTYERPVIEQMLKHLDPTVDPKASVPGLSSVCFADGLAWTFDGTVGRHVTLKLPFTGAVDARTMLEWVSACAAKEIEFQHEKDNLAVRCGRARCTLPIVPDFYITPPDKSGIAMKFTEEMLSALNAALPSMSDSLDHPWQYGVTVHVEKGLVTFYSCDNLTAARVPCKAKTPQELRDVPLALPPHLVAYLAKRKAGVVLYVSDEWLVVPGDDVTVFSRRIPDGDLAAYAELFIDVGSAEKCNTLPVTWRGIFMRAAALLRGEKGASAALVVEKGGLTVLAESKLGRARDSSKLKLPHEDVSTRVQPETMMRVSAQDVRFRVAPNKVVFHGPGPRVLVASTLAE